MSDAQQARCDARLRRSALQGVLDAANVLADNGEADDAVRVRDAAVESYLRGDDADAIVASAWID